MIGIDTNVLLRFLLIDDQAQHAAAVRFMSQRTSNDPAFISSIVLAETIWFLRRVEGRSATTIFEAMARLLDADDVLIEDAEVLSDLFSGRSKGDIADHLVARAGERVGARTTVTFDRKAARDVPGMLLLT